MFHRFFKSTISIYNVIHDINDAAYLYVFHKNVYIFPTQNFIFEQIGFTGYPEKLEEIHEIEVMAVVEDVVSCQAFAQRG